MRNKLLMLWRPSTAMVAPAAAQNGPPSRGEPVASRRQGDRREQCEVHHCHRHRLEGLSGAAVRPRRPAALGLEELYVDH